MVEGTKARHVRLLSNYYTLKRNLHGAKLLKKIGDILGLAGDFSDIDKILVCYVFLFMYIECFELCVGLLVSVHRSY